MKRSALSLLLLLSSGTMLRAQQTTYDFLHLDVSARVAALNGSFVSMKDDPNVIFYNPASIATITAPRISVSYLKHLLDVNSGSLSYARAFPGIGTVGAGLTYIDYGSFDQTDELLNVTGSFGARELAFVAGIATQYEDNLFVGANVKFIYSDIASNQSTALAVDAGVLYDIPSQNLTVGASILTLGTQLTTYAGVRENLPLDISIGVTKRPEHVPVLLNLNFHRLNESASSVLDHLRSFTLGAEFLMSQVVRLRVGYNNAQHQDLKMGTSAGLAGYSLGVGIVLKDYQVDYAYNSFGKTGGLNRFSVGINL